MRVVVAPLANLPVAGAISQAQKGTKRPASPPRAAVLSLIPIEAPPPPSGLLHALISACKGTQSAPAASLVLICQNLCTSWETNLGLQSLSFLYSAVMASSAGEVRDLMLAETAKLKPLERLVISKAIDDIIRPDTLLVLARNESAAAAVLAARRALQEEIRCRLSLRADPESITLEKAPPSPGKSHDSVRYLLGFACQCFNCKGSKITLHIESLSKFRGVTYHYQAADKAAERAAPAGNPAVSAADATAASVLTEKALEADAVASSSSSPASAGGAPFQ